MSGLTSLRGEAAPPGIAADLARVLALPLSARQRLWEVLGPCLREPLGKDIEAKLDAFCKAHQAPDADVARGIKACRFLLRQAAALDVTKADFTEDLRRIGDGAALAELLLPGFDQAKAVVRLEIARAAIVDHGALLEGVDWRVDTIGPTNRGEGLGVPVGVVTLRICEGDERRRVTLQILPDVAAELRRLCDKLAGS